jgi:quercetin dioxygenase-like cupin family protein
MRRTTIILGLTLAVGITLGAFGERFLSAQQSGVKRTELLKTAIAGMEGKEAIMYVAELPPGAAAGKHTHPGEEFAYILDGTLTLEPQGQAPKTYKAGEVFHNPAKVVHDAKNMSTTAPSKVLVFLLAEKGQPLASPAQ